MPRIAPSCTSRSTRETNLPWLPLAIRKVLPDLTGSGSASWVWPGQDHVDPGISMANFRSTSKPLWERQDDDLGARVADLLHDLGDPLARRPKLSSGNIQPGWRWACRGRPARSPPILRAAALEDLVGS
jgi:hypothetical protein